MSKGKGKGKAEAKDEPEDEARAASKGKGKLEETPEAPKAVVDKGKGKAVETGDTESPTDSKPSAHPGDASALPHSQKLATLDIFAGCGGLSEGLQQSGCTETKWAIEYEHPAAEAFKLNHPHAHVFCHNCNVILRYASPHPWVAPCCLHATGSPATVAKSFSGSPVPPFRQSGVEFNHSPVRRSGLGVPSMCPDCTCSVLGVGRNRMKNGRWEAENCVSTGRHPNTSHLHPVCAVCGGLGCAAVG